MKADSAKVSRLLKTARGQLDGILNMMEEDRYCVDISHQLLATVSIIKKANAEVLRAHLRHCVHDSLENGTEAERLEKIEELLSIIGKNA